MWLLLDGIDNILKKYLDSSQSYPKDRDKLAKVNGWLGNARKNEVKFNRGKQKVKDEKGNDVDVDGILSLK